MTFHAPEHLNRLHIARLIVIARGLGVRVMIKNFDRRDIIASIYERQRHYRLREAKRGLFVGCLFFLLSFTVAVEGVQGGTIPPQGRNAPTVRGTASWEGQEDAGKTTASGVLFDPHKLTAASWQWPLGTLVRVVGPSGKSVVVRIVDRGPAHRLAAKGRIIDLSEAAFKRIADTKQGVVQVAVEQVKK